MDKVSKVAGTGYADRHDWRSTPLSVLEPVAPIITVDIGARNGPFDVKKIEPVSAIYCFEPNIVEFNKLQGDKTNSYGLQRCGEIRNFPAAVCHFNGSATLNISRRPGATSTLVPNKEVLSHFKADNWSELAEIVDRVEVPAVTLSDFIKSASLEHIDFLKLDTQGNELDILRSSGSDLSRVGVIKTQVEFISMYEGQALFDQVAGYLHNFGFELVDIEIVPANRRFHRFSHLPPSAYRLVWADLIMVRKPFDFNDPRIMAKAAVLAALGYTDMACYMVHNAPLVNEAIYERFERMAFDLAKPKTLQARFRSKIERIFGLLMSRYDWKRGHQVKSAR